MCLKLLREMLVAGTLLFLCSCSFFRQDQGRISVPEQASNAEADNAEYASSVGGEEDTIVENKRISESKEFEKKNSDNKKGVPKFFYKRHKPVPFLLITSYYELAFKLAEVARRTADVPYIIIPADSDVPDGTTKLSFRGFKTDDEFVLDAAKLSKFIAYIRPKSVIILGNKGYVSDAYRSAIPKGINVIEILDDDWKISALKLKDLTHSPKVYAAYLRWEEEQKKGIFD